MMEEPPTGAVVLAVLLGVLAVAAIIGGLRAVRRDGYGRREAERDDDPRRPRT